MVVLNEKNLPLTFSERVFNLQIARKGIIGIKVPMRVLLRYFLLHSTSQLVCSPVTSCMQRDPGEQARLPKCCMNTSFCLPIGQSGLLSGAPSVIAQNLWQQYRLEAMIGEEEIAPSPVASLALEPGGHMVMGSKALHGILEHRKAF